MHVGIDFGTSNTMVATEAERGQVRFLEFDLLSQRTASYRSLLFFDPEDQEPAQAIEYYAGTQAIEAYLDALGEGRLIQSFKTHLTSQSLGRTQIGPHLVSLDQMLSLFFARLREHIKTAWGEIPSKLVLGRPVNFAGASNEEDNLQAQARLDKAARASGFEQVEFRLEPIAAAYHYERRLKAPELVLVADFGGGTTDFCLMNLGAPPSHGDRSQNIVATGGVGIAGDDLDAAILDHVVSPALGKGSQYREFGKVAQIPASYYNKLARWHQLSFLRSQRTREELERLQRAALYPDRIAGLIHIVENNQGFHLHKSVERLKIALSSEAQASFEFQDEALNIEVPVTRQDFERWIEPCVDEMAQALDATLRSAKVSPAQVDRVFMTGGTAFVPMVRRVFASRFGPEKLAGGDEMLSIASGLAAPS